MMSFFPLAGRGSLLQDSQMPKIASVARNRGGIRFPRLYNMCPLDRV